MGYWDETLRWGFDWMMKAHPSADVLYVGVGDGKVDNNYWVGQCCLYLDALARAKKLVF